MIMRPSVESVEDLLCVCKEIGLNKDMAIAEIGSYAGESAEIFAKFAGVVYCVDEWCPMSMDGIDDAEKRFDNVCGVYGNIRKIKLRSCVAATHIVNRSLDFVYIDANHEYEGAAEDINLWLPKIVSGGYIGGHDYHQDYPGVRRAVNEILGGPDKVFNYFSWVKKI